MELGALPLSETEPALCWFHHNGTNQTCRFSTKQAGDGGSLTNLLHVNGHVFPAQLKWASDNVSQHSPQAQHVTAAVLHERLLEFGNQDALMGTKICDLRMYLYFKNKLWRGGKSKSNTHLAFFLSYCGEEEDNSSWDRDRDRDMAWDTANPSGIDSTKASGLLPSEAQWSLFLHICRNYSAEDMPWGGNGIRSISSESKYPRLRYWLWPGEPSIWFHWSRVLAQQRQYQNL